MNSVNVLVRYLENVILTRKSAKTGRLLFEVEWQCLFHAGNLQSKCKLVFNYKLPIQTDDDDFPINTAQVGDSNATFNSVVQRFVLLHNGNSQNSECWIFHGDVSTLAPIYFFFNFLRRGLTAMTVTQIDMERTFKALALQDLIFIRTGAEKGKDSFIIFFFFLLFRLFMMRHVMNGC